MSTSSTSRAARATIEDVAAAAGVSVATVSRALRDLPNVAESTRTRVREAAERLEYRADPAASRLAAGRSRSVAVVVQLLNGWYSSHVVAGVEAVCAEAGYDTLVIGVGRGLHDRDVFAGSEAIHRRVDAIIFVDVPVSPTQLASLEQSLVVASVGHELPQLPSVGIDDVEVGRIATQHLIDLGHRRIGLVNGPDTEPFVVPRHRQTGHEAALRDAGIEIDERLYVAANFTIQDGADALDHLMQLDDPPTAIFALADEMAFGVLQAARARGLRVPDDLSVIGVDDHDVAEVVDLTTIHQDVAEHGARAARLVVEQLAGNEVDVHQPWAPVRLVVRATTGPAPDHHST